MRNSLSAVSERLRGLASALAARAMRAILALALSLPTGPTQRLMTKGAQKITYGLYQDPKYKTPWGDAVGYQAGGTGAGSSQVLTVYGQVPAQTTPAPGVYTDTVVVTLSY